VLGRYVVKEYGKCTADPPSAGNWQYKSSVLGRYVVKEYGKCPDDPPVKLKFHANKCVV
jgi:hypothetical protein